MTSKIMPRVLVARRQPPPLLTWTQEFETIPRLQIVPKAERILSSETETLFATCAAEQRRTASWEALVFVALGVCALFGVVLALFAALLR
jgi:hypothetical protein